jgi:NAD-dependent deacetylase
MVDRVDFARYRRVVFLTGAGISAASGLPTYRGEGGLWNAESMRLADAGALTADPAAVWAMFAPWRARALAATPNAAHRAIAALEDRVAETASVTVLTQNVDGLHARAGSRAVVELHGSLFRTRCSSCDAPAYADDDASKEAPRCPRCGAVARIDVVLFGEALPAEAEWEAKKALRDCDLFVAVGTSGSVLPASSFVRSAAYEGARTILVNLEPMSPRNDAFGEELLGPAEDVLPRLLGTTER